MPPSQRTSRLLILSRSTLLFVVLLLLTLHPPAVHGSTPQDAPPTNGDKSNYGDFHRSAQYAREHLPETPSTDIPAFKSTAEEDLYYFFSLHDLNGDHHLDGHELRNAFTHAGEMPPPDMRMTVADTEGMIDHALLEDDTNYDGLVSWEEYLASQLYHDD
ncbi:hypothetical protein HKX48_003238 [Thoreauomyces humboldtii]|nr:hypothetical protein HKX48_003238 [Thoreauomyces humboldtii]